VSNIILLISTFSTAVQNKDVFAMDRLVRAAEAVNISSRVIDDAKIIIDREGLVGSVRQLLQSASDFKTLSDAIEKAIQLGISGDEMDAARARQLKMSNGSSVAEEVQSAIRNIDVVKATENGLSPEDLQPLRKALQGCVPALIESDSAISDLKKQADSTLLRAEKQLELQNALLGISDLSPMIEIKKTVRLAGDAGLKNFHGGSFNILFLMNLHRLNTLATSVMIVHAISISLLLRLLLQ
jgi:hypothetical protein